MAGRSPSAFIKCRAPRSIFLRDRSTPPCTASSGAAGSKPNGAHRTTTAEPSTTRSRARAESSWSSRRNRGASSPPPWPSFSTWGDAMTLSEIWSDVRYRVRAILRHDVLEQDLDEELRFHIERETEKYVAAGMPRDVAARQARLAFG